MECHECHKAIADNSTFCPYCGTPVRREARERSEALKPHDVPKPHEQLAPTPAPVPPPAPPRRGKLPFVAAGAVVMLLLFAVLTRCGSGTATVSQPSLPEPFKGTISLNLSDALQLRFLVDEGQSTFSLDIPQMGEILEVSADIDLVDTELGSGVYDYTLDGLAANGMSAPSLEEWIQRYGESEEGSVEYLELLDGSRVQLVIPTGAASGSLVGTWAVRDETGKAAIASFPIFPKGVELAFFELKATFDEDGSFGITQTIKFRGGADESETTEHEMVETLTGSWHAEGSRDAVIQVEEYHATFDGVADTASEENFDNGYTWTLMRTMSVDLDVAGDQAGTASDDASQADEGASEPASEAGEAEEQAPVDVPVDEAMPEEITGGQEASAGSDAVDAELAFVARSRDGLAVPDRPEITYEIAESYLWEGTGMWVTPIAFFENGELVTRADCTDDGTPVTGMLAYTGDRS